MVHGVVIGAEPSAPATPKAVRVSGDSMRPSLRDGDLVLVEPLAPGELPRVGEVVLARHPFHTDREILKRVIALGAGVCTLRGDNAPQSTDSRTFGDLPIELLRGRVVGIWRPPG